MLCGDASNPSLLKLLRDKKNETVGYKCARTLNDSMRLRAATDNVFREPGSFAAYFSRGGSRADLHAQTPP